MSGFRPDRSRFSIHARVAGTEPATWEDPSLVQLWGPRFSVFAVAARDLPVFSLGTMPDDAKGRQRARELAADLAAALGGDRIPRCRRGRGRSLPLPGIRGQITVRWDA
jgi:hypothetical protein